MTKSDRDILLEDAAHRLNARLIGTGVSVAGGGSRGPYSVSVICLDHERLGRVLAAVLAATGGAMRPEGGRSDA